MQKIRSAISKIRKIEAKERNMIDDACEMNCHNVKYYLPNKQTQERSDKNVGI